MVSARHIPAWRGRSSLASFPLALGASRSGPQFPRCFRVGEVTATRLEEKEQGMDWLVVGAQLLRVKGGVQRNPASFCAPFHRGLLPTCMHRRGEETLVLPRLPSSEWSPPTPGPQSSVRATHSLCACVPVCL